MPTVPTALAARFEEAVGQYLEAAAPMRSTMRDALLGQAEALFRSDEGLGVLYGVSLDLALSGFFDGTPWEHLDRLDPALLPGTLVAGHPHSTWECLSTLRILRASESPDPPGPWDQESYRQFVERGLVESFHLLGEQPDEAGRAVSDRELQKARRLLRFVMDRLPGERVRQHLVQHVDELAVQRPILVDTIVQQLELLRDRYGPSAEGRFGLPEMEAGTADTRTSDADRLLQQYLQAAFGVGPDATPSGPTPDVGDAQRAATFGALLTETGLVSPGHAALVRRLAHRAAKDDAALEQLAVAMALDESGRLQLRTHRELACTLIMQAVHPGTEQAVYGLARLLERDLLSREAVRAGLAQFSSLRPNADAERTLKRAAEARGLHLDPLPYLLSGTLQVLGHPLGIRQGKNPTCQSARGMSLWSLHAPGKLLNLILTAVRSNSLEFRFEGQLLDSAKLRNGSAPAFDLVLDPVSALLVPHLDCIYNEMMQRAALRGQDPHQWVNPAFYGQWVASGFASAVDPVTNSVPDFMEFVRTLYATHHPEVSGGMGLLYTNPVGLFVTNDRAQLLGFHAISLLRVAVHHGVYRAYFYNPNAQGEQNWGQGIRPTVRGNGERPGESSLPFSEFAARLYAFHYNRATADSEAAKEHPDLPVVERLARDSWGRKYLWPAPAPKPLP